jgi:hemolysin III
MYYVRRHAEPGFKTFLRRTISAQLHFWAFIAALVGLVVLLRFAWTATGQAKHVIACAAFGLTSVLLFAVSMTYHFLHDGFSISARLMHLFEELDHFAIYLFIAGTYTPFLLNAVAEPWTTILLASVWSIALIGTLYTRIKSRLPKWAQHRFAYTGLFLLMGWTILVRAGEIYNALNQTQLMLLLAGAASYTVGAVVYATERPSLFREVFGFHELWHTLVIGGFVPHYFLILHFYRA